MAKKVLRCGDKLLDLTHPCVMGILNVTPDSFSDGGLLFSTDKVSLQKVLQRAEAMIQAGAKILDIGGESTRPGAQTVTLDEERQRVLPVVKAIKEKFPQVVISVDTSKPELMADAIEAGCDLVNDVNALQAPGALEVCSNSNIAVGLMHMQGEPRTMQQNPHYEDVVEQVYRFLQDRINSCLEAGIARERLVIDPGFGFGKSVEHNLLLMKQLERFTELNTTLLVGLSRKSLIGKILDKPVEQRVIGSVVLATLALARGADIVRAHDVDETMDAVKLTTAVETV